MLEFYYQKVMLSCITTYIMNLYPYPLSLFSLSNNVFITVWQIQAKGHNVGH
jgi:hypothetical protein